MRTNPAGNEGALKATIELAVTKARKSTLMEYLQSNIKKEADLKDVRKRLAKIGTPMSKEVRESRAERL